MILCYFALLSMTLLGAVAALFLKKSATSSSFVKNLGNPNLYFGCALYVLAAIVNIYVLRFLDYSMVLPLTSLTYVWTMFISKFFLGEDLSKKKILGVSLIVIGATLISLMG